MYDFTPIDNPESVDLYVSKLSNKNGFDWVAFRTVIGDVNHVTRTNGRIEHIYGLMAPGGDREDDLLVDTVIGRDGRIGLLNDPFITKDEARASWVNNGPGTQLSLAGAQFVSRFGTVGLGRYLVSKAHICRADQDLTDAQFEASARVSAAIHQQACCPWDRFPFNPLYGLSLSFWHCAFGADACPGDVFQRHWAQPLEDRIRALLRRAQTGVAEDFTPPVAEVAALHDPRYPDGWSEAVARFRFGELRSCGPDGTVEVLTFDPTHVICNEWLCQGWHDGDWPEALIWIRAGTAEGGEADLVVFQGGKRLVRRGLHEPWRWERLGERTREARKREVDHALGT
jgi:hypothetical protein